MRQGKTTMAKRPWDLAAGLCLVALGLLLVAGAARAETIALDRIEHIHGLAVDPTDPVQLYLATHHGLFLAKPDGTATRIGSSQDDLMSFAVDPRDPETFYASGHPPGGGNLGVLASRDRGADWQRLAPGADGPVDFHAMTVSRADPNVIYGLYKGLQVSGDGGRTWRRAGTLPKDTFDLAGSAHDAATLYAASRGGLFVSRDSGATWTPAYPQARPTTLVQVADGSLLYAFVYGVGLVAGREPGTGWELRSDRFGGRYVLHMAVDPTNPDVLHVVADTGAVLTSKDGGRSWESYVGHDDDRPQVVRAGGELYDGLCRSCHGARGAGERPEDMYAQDDYGIVAPPLDDSAHGWHHSDRQLVGTILNGSPRNPRMLPFKAMIGEDEARTLVGYIKSLWSFPSLACQGARHMRCQH